MLGQNDREKFLFTRRFKSAASQLSHLIGLQEYIIKKYKRQFTQKEHSESLNLLIEILEFIQNKGLQEKYELAELFKLLSQVQQS